MVNHDSPRLIAELGGRNAQLALAYAPGQLSPATTWPCAEHADFGALIHAYLGTLPAQTSVRHAAVAISHPVDGDWIRLDEAGWAFSIEAVRSQLGLETLVVVNDFTALAMGLPRLGPSQRRAVGGGQARERGVIGLLGPGSGLGVSGLIPSADGSWIALGAEGGHASVAPRDERELGILRQAWREFGHVSFERLLSAAGLVLIHRCLRADPAAPSASISAPELAPNLEIDTLPTAATDAPARQAEAIIERALTQQDPLCLQTLDVFCGLLGTAAGNLALSLGAVGGIYIGGDIVPRLGSYLAQSPFRARFEDHGRFSDYLKAIPSFVITEARAAALGLAAILQAQLQRLEQPPAGALLAQIRRAQAQLSPAERRVAAHVLQQPRAVLNDPIAAIAQAAQVSQPTVIRFCRSLGCAGLADFKRRLATGLSGTIPLSHTQVSFEDSVADLSAKVLNNSAAALLQLREQLNRDSLDQAIEGLASARRIECLALGEDASVALDAQRQLLGLGLACGASTTPGLPALTAAVMQAGDLALLICRSGQTPELLEAGRSAQARGARVLALTASQSPLARQADVLMVLDPTGSLSPPAPTLTRLQQLALIDILSQGLGLRHTRTELPDARLMRA